MNFDISSHEILDCTYAIFQLLHTYRGTEFKGTLLYKPEFHCRFCIVMWVGGYNFAYNFDRKNINKKKIKDILYRRRDFT